MAKTGLPNFTMDVSGPWRGITKVQSWASSHSGSAFTTESDQIAFLQSVWNVLSSFISAAYSGETTLWMSKVSYYNGTGGTTIYEAEYVDSAAAVAAGYEQTHFGSALNLGDDPVAPEICILLEAPIGLSKSGKPVTMKKFVHWTQGIGTAPSIDESGEGGAAIAATLGNGGLYGSRVLTSPHGAQGDWVIYPYFSNHQMQRRRKKKTSSSSSSSGSGLLNSILAGAGGSALVEAILEAITA